MAQQMAKALFLLNHIPHNPLYIIITSTGVAESSSFDFIESFFDDAFVINIHHV